MHFCFENVTPVAWNKDPEEVYLYLRPEVASGLDSSSTRKRWRSFCWFFFWIWRLLEHIFFWYIRWGSKCWAWLSKLWRKSTYYCGARKTSGSFSHGQACFTVYYDGHWCSCQFFDSLRLIQKSKETAILVLARYQLSAVGFSTFIECPSWSLTVMAFLLFTWHLVIPSFLETHTKKGCKNGLATSSYANIIWPWNSSSSSSQFWSSPQSLSTVTEWFRPCPSQVHTSTRPMQ